MKLSLYGQLFLALALFPVSLLRAQTVHDFDSQTLTGIYYSEGAGVGDINGDGHQDVIYGPYWFEGPEFRTAHEIYEAKPQPMHGYADHFFAWTQDFNNDQHPDVLVVGFPGTPSYVYENPGGNWDQPWKKHQVADWVSNEAPQFVDLTGDGKRELVFTRDGVFGFAQPREGTFQEWTFYPVSDSVASKQFGHGLGIGDVNGDQRQDVLTKNGWFEQPEDATAGRWTFHPFAFAGPGGAEMYAYDVDGDGDNDVITSLHAHEYGLAWWEQVEPKDGEPQFQQHLIMGSAPSQNPYGVFFSELHSVALEDIDGDGLKDIITGKTYWSHHRQSPGWDAGAVVYWFQLKRREDGTIDWVPHLADDSAGIGRQITIADINQDQKPDIVTGGMLGCHVLTHVAKTVSPEEYAAAQPQKRRELTEDLTGEQAAKRMNVPQGFQVQLAAAEPDIHQPVAMAFDRRGRLWVAEAYTYPIPAKEGEGLDKIVILEDEDQDGVFDSRKVFAENLNLVSGLEIGYGGVWVGAAPYFMFIPDQDGDDVPDAEPQILLDGFGFQDTHETLNTFNWGPDGWLYGCHGVFTHSRVGKPGTPDDQRTPMNAAIWRYHPVQHQFEIFAEGTSNPWGVDFNDHGQAFATACVIPHLYHVIQGGRYQRQAGQHFNPYTYDDIKTVADHLHYAGNIQDHAWWGEEPPIQSDTSDAGGGHAHCGAMIYLGDNWPLRYRNSLFMNNIHGNRVNNDRPSRQGSGYVGKHGDDLLLANDRWFRGINLRYGPDGTVYLIDWYDRNACHRTNPEIWDRTNGRVYNISFGQPDRQTVDLGKMNDAELAKLAWHQNDWYVRTARRELAYRSANGKLDEAVVRDEIKKLVESDQADRVLRGMWLGHATNLTSEEHYLKLLRTASSPYVKAWAIQLAAEDRDIPAAMLSEMERLAGDSQQDAIVRLYLASAAQRLPTEDRWTLVENLLRHENDASDHNLPLMIWYALEPLVPQDPARALKLDFGKMQQVAEFTVRRAASSAESLDQLLAGAADFDAEGRLLVLRQVSQAMKGRVNVPMPDSWNQAYELFMDSGNAEVTELALRLAVKFGDRRVFPKLRETLADATAAVEARQQALEILVAGQDKEAAEAIQKAVAEPKLQGAAIRALAAYSHPATPDVLLEAYDAMPPANRSDAVATLVSRASYATPLLDAIEAEKVPTTDLHAYHVRQLQSFGDEMLIERLEQVWGAIGTSSASEMEAMANYKQLLTPDYLQDADLSHGRMLFQKTCATCHKLFGEGQLVGPDLTGSNRANLDYILENILAPSSVVGKDYQMTLLQLIDGRVVSGLVKQETDSALTLQTINDEVVIPLEDIEARKLSELSLMPTGLIEAMEKDDVRDLIKYLASPKQVPLKGPQAPIDASTGKVPNALEGEAMKVIEKSGGRVSSQDMRGFPADKWSGNDHLWWTGAKPGDRLSLEVPVSESGLYDLHLSLTQAVDYGIVQLYWDDQPLGGPIDCFVKGTVITTGMLPMGTMPLEAGNHKLTLEVVGANSEAVPAHLVALDFLLLEPAEKN